MKKGAKSIESRLEILSELSGILFGKADSRLFWINSYWEANEVSRR